MEQRFTIVTLGSRDLPASIAFFERLGWKKSGNSDGIAFFQCGCVALALYPSHELAKDAGVARSEGDGFRGFTIAYNTRSKDEVDDILRDASAAGAEITKPAADAFWGGYSGYFRDCDGHLWEVAWNPFFSLDANGAVHLP